MRTQKNNGSLAIFIEMLLLVFLVIAFLFATKARNEFKKEQDYVRSIYPGGSQLLASKNSPNSYSELVPEANQQFVEVNYTNIGFVPEIIQLSGDNRAVLFRNQSSRLMWVSSDPYPSGSDFPMLNEKAGVPSGGVYWFVFPAGAKSYKYHNRLMPSDKGTVIVR